MRGKRQMLGHRRLDVSWHLWAGAKRGLEARPSLVVLSGPADH